VEVILLVTKVDHQSFGQIKKGQIWQDKFEVRLCTNHTFIDTKIIQIVTAALGESLWFHLLGLPWGNKIKKGFLC
jgi:hypothetical protein